MKIWEAQVRVPDGAGTRIIAVKVMATSSHQARLLLEQQHGRTNVLTGPRWVNQSG
jgi:hypothetical protein